MNIAQMRQAMTYLWGTHPSAMSFSDVDKKKIIASYFRVLYKFSLKDVLVAIDEACRLSPKFIPSAFEIEAKCTANPDVTPFLPKEYFALDKQGKEYAGLYYRDYFEARAASETAQTDEERQKFAAIAEGIKERMEVESQMYLLYRDAEIQALRDYERRESALAADDLNAIRFERPALNA